jgi:hypothetical protein
MRRALAAAVLMTLALSGCSASGEPPAAEPPTANDSPSRPDSPAKTPSGDAGDDAQDAIEIEIEGDRIEPNGKRVEVSAGEPIRLAVTSDRAAELHVHSSPGQELSVARGDSTLTLRIETPGLVDVEEHESGIVVLRLEVR